MESNPQPVADEIRFSSTSDNGYAHRATGDDDEVARHFRFGGGESSSPYASEGVPIGVSVAPPVPVGIRRALALHEKRQKVMHRLAVLQERGKMSKKKCEQIIKDLDGMTGPTEEQLDQIDSTLARLGYRPKASSRESSCAQVSAASPDIASPTSCTRTSIDESSSSTAAAAPDNVMSSEQEQENEQDKDGLSDSKISNMLGTAPDSMRRYGKERVANIAEKAKVSTKVLLARKKQAALAIQRVWRGFRARRWFSENCAQLEMAQSERRVTRARLIEERNERIKGTRAARASGLFSVMGTRPTSAQLCSKRPRSALPMAGSRATKLTVDSLQRSVGMTNADQAVPQSNAESSLVKSWLIEATSVKGNMISEKTGCQKPVIYLASGGSLEPVNPRLLQKVMPRRSREIQKGC